MGRLCYAAPTIEQIPMLVELDSRCLGGMWSANSYQRELESPNGVLRILAADADRVIGLGCFWGIVDEAHITLLAIDSAYQRQGLGRWLLVNLLREACGRELRHATLEVRLSNAIAQRLYQQFGFQSLGRRKRYYPDDEDALILWRSGLQEPTFRDQLQSWHHTAHHQLTLQGWQLTKTEIPQ